MYKRWTPGSRRDRRRARSSSSRSSRSQGADRSILLVAGLFILGVVVVFGLFLLLVTSGG